MPCIKVQKKKPRVIWKTRYHLKRHGNGPIFVIFYKSIWERSYKSVKTIFNIKFVDIFKIKNKFPSSAIVETRQGHL